MDKKLINELASELLISLSEEEANEFTKEFAYFLAQASLLEEIEGIDDVEPLIFPFKNEHTYLREDEVSETPTKEEILENSRNAKDGFVVIPRVVK